MNRLKNIYASPRARHKYRDANADPCKHILWVDGKIAQVYNKSVDKSSLKSFIGRELSQGHYHKRKTSCSMRALEEVGIKEARGIAAPVLVTVVGMCVVSAVL